MSVIFKISKKICKISKINELYGICLIFKVINIVALLKTIFSEISPFVIFSLVVTLYESTAHEREPCKDSFSMFWM